VLAVHTVRHHVGGTSCSPTNHNASCWPPSLRDTSAAPRFNLRALERFFPDHGHVYIVTDA
jgi:hypothetical protein